MNARAFIAALTMIVMVSGSTATSSLFVQYRADWGITSADIAIVFSAYVGTLLPMLLLSGGLAERFGRRRLAVAGIISMAIGLLTLTLAQNLAWLIVARLFQGLAVGVAVGPVSAVFAESYRGKLPAGSVMQSIAALGLLSGPVISAIAFNFGGGIHLSYVPTLILVTGLLALTPFIAARPTNASGAPAAEVPLPEAAVASALRFALPSAFVGWAGLSLLLSLVPAYLAATLHAANPAIGAAAIAAAQFTSLVATLVLRDLVPERGGVYGAFAAVFGLALLVVGTSTNIWPLVVIATLLVGGGSGIASAAAFGIAGKIGQGQRTRIFARMYVAAYMGYSVPALAIGLIAVHTSFAVAFIIVTVALGALAAVLPALRAGRDRNVVVERELVARAA